MRRNTDTPASSDAIDDGAIQLLTAGFPCQNRGATDGPPRSVCGFSSMGRRTGYAHAESGLFSHVVRLVAHLQPAYFLLENVPGILRAGMERVVDNLCAGAGYELRWCVLAAGDLGALHERRRWFCLGRRRDIGDDAVDRDAAEKEVHFWDRGR